MRKVSIFSKREIDMLVHEALGYNRFGLRYVTREELDARCKRVFSFDFSSKEHNRHKPLESYQDGKKSLRMLVVDRYQDEADQLKKEYQDFFKFPQSPEFQEYQRKKQHQEKDYHAQKKWVEIYYSYDKEILSGTIQMLQSIGIGSLLASVGTIAITSHSPFAPAMAALCYLGAMYSFHTGHLEHAALKDIPKSKERAKMILEDWYKPDPLARYDRSLLNDNLQLLNKKKTTQIRQNKKRELVAQYRLNHPKDQSNCHC